MQLREIRNGKQVIDVETRRNPTGVPEEKERKNDREAILEKIMANNFPKLKKDQDLHFEKNK